MDSTQRALIDTDSLPSTSVWELWGLEQYGNKILMPNKVDYVDGSYLNVLCQVSVLLQRSGLTIQDLNVIFADSRFSGVQYKPDSSEIYQLANIDGYRLVSKESTSFSWDSFFKRLAVLLHRKNILGWDLQDLLLTFDLDVGQLDVICEMCSRYGISVREAFGHTHAGDAQRDIPTLDSDCRGSFAYPEGFRQDGSHRFRHGKR